MKRFSRPVAFALAFAFTLVFSVGALAVEDYGYSVMPLVSVSGYDVKAFHSRYMSTNAPSFSSSVPDGKFTYASGYGNFGYVVTLPPSTFPGTLFVSGFSLVWYQSASSKPWTTIDIPQNNPVVQTVPSSYFLSSSSTAFNSLLLDKMYFPSFDGSVYIPAHTSPLYLFVFSYANSGDLGVVRFPGSFISFSPDSAFQSQSTLQSILSVLQGIASGGSNSPVDSLVGGWSDKFQGQISQVEDALSPSNPALPNGGDIGGFVTDVSDGLGLSGSSFSSSDFNEATSGFSGSASTGTGGPWEFFTQGVADDLSGDSPMGIDDDYDPIIAWMEQAERRRDSWFNPS